MYYPYPSTSIKVLSLKECEEHESFYPYISVIQPPNINFIAQISAGYGGYKNFKMIIKKGDLKP